MELRGSCELILEWPGPGSREDAPSSRSCTSNADDAAILGDKAVEVMPACMLEIAELVVDRGDAVGLCSKAVSALVFDEPGRSWLAVDA